MQKSEQTSTWPLALLKVAGLLAVCVVSGLIGAASTRSFGASSYTISYVDFISIMLTAVSLLMTVLAIFLAIVGFLGWTTIEQKVHSKAENFLADGFKEDGRLMDMLNERLTSAADEKSEEIMKIIEARIIAETQDLMFKGIETVEASDTDEDKEGEEG